MAIQESEGLDAKEIAGNLLDRTTTGVSKQDIAELVELFRHGKTFGSLITVPEGLAEKLPALSDIVNAKLRSGDMFARQAAEAILPFVEQAKILAGKYDCVVANPPYMGGTLHEFSTQRLCKGEIRTLQIRYIFNVYSKNIG